MSSFAPLLPKLDFFSSMRFASDIFSFFIDPIKYSLLISYGIADSLMEFTVINNSMFIFITVMTDLWNSLF